MRDLEDNALHEFDQFIREWIGPAAAYFVWRTGNNAAERVRVAIRKLAAAKDTAPSIGWAVYRRTIITTYDRERPSGYQHEQMGVIVENLGQTENILAYCRKKWPTDEFVVGAIQQVELKR